MKKLYVFTILIFISIAAIGQNWQWSKSEGFTMPNSTGNVKLSSSGNLVSYLSETTSKATYMVYSNANGDTLWKKHFTNLVIKDVCIDANDNIYFAGVFWDTINIDGFTFISNGSLDAIIGKIKNHGGLIKAKVFGTNLPEYANSLVLNNNDVIVTGGIINSQMVDSVQLTGSGIRFDAFILKLDSAFVAYKSFETVSSGAWGAQGIKVAVDQYNSIYFIGNSEYTLSVGSTTLYTSNGQFFVKLTNNLQLIYAKAIIPHWTSGYYRPFIFFDSNNDIVLGRVTGGGGSASHNLSVEKFNSSCIPLWQQVVNINSDHFMDIDNQNNIWAGGRHYIGNNIPSYSVVKINTAGSPTQIIYDQTILHSVQGIAVKANNDFYVIGDCSASSSLNGYSCSPDGSIFMARYIQSITTTIKEDKKEGKMLVYPNPSSGKYYIKFTGLEGRNNNSFIKIKNILGEDLLTLPFLIEQTIDISNQPKGIYFLQVNLGNKTQVKKIILE